MAEEQRMLAASSVKQEGVSKPTPHAQGAAPASYYVDFRSIDGFVYGHTHIAYGRLNARGEPIDVRYAGFEPEGGGFGLRPATSLGSRGPSRPARRASISRSSTRIAAG